MSSRPCHLLLGAALAVSLLACGAPTTVPEDGSSSTNTPSSAPGSTGSTGTASQGQSVPDAGAASATSSDAGTALVDGDGDGIDDRFEDALAQKFAPQVRLHPDEVHFPASVDWYLARVELRLSQPSCPDDSILALGSVTMTNLSQQVHAERKLTSFCHLTRTELASNESGRYFLKPHDDATFTGDLSGHWPVYTHVRHSPFVAQGYDVQYWFFYAYDHAILDVNHQGDWEHITITTDADGNFVQAYYSEHYSGDFLKGSEMTWVDDTHPVVWSSIGKHASYAKPGDYPIPGMIDRAADGGKVWETRTQLINLGERGRPLNGQTFLLYGGIWGSFGDFPFTTGPTGPAFKDRWDKD